MNRRLRLWLAVGAAALVAGTVTLAVTADPGQRPSGWDLFSHALPPLSFLGVGLVLWDRRPDSPIGRLMFLAGVAWEIPWVGFLRTPLTFTIANLTSSLYEVPLGHLAVAYPGGRLRSRLDRSVVIAIWSWWVLNNLAFMLTWDPGADGPLRPGERNVLHVVTLPGFQRVLRDMQFPVTAVLVLLVAAALIRHWLVAGPPGRRVLRPMVWTLVPTAGYIVMQELGGDGLLSPTLIRAFFTFGPLAVATLPVAMLVGLMRARMARGAVSDLVTELSLAPAPGRLREALARALDDPSVELGYPFEDGYVDVEGRAIVLPGEGSGRAVTRLESGGRELAVLVYDEALAEEPERVSGVSAAVRLAMENERLQAEVRAQLEEVRASRARILHAGDTERRRIERNLHDGAQQRLLTLALALRMAESRAEGLDPELEETLRGAGKEVREALEDLRALAGGLHPMVLTRGGLSAAIRTLAERAPVPVEIQGAPDERFHEDVEAAAYFVISEALVNAGKHAGASRVRVRVHRDAEVLRVEVADDGTGGADPAKGSGLTGLADRVAALGGTLSVRGGSGGGTVVRAELPCAPSVGVDQP